MAVGAMGRRLTAGLCGLALGTADTAPAAGGDGLVSEMALLDSIPIVVSATRLAQRTDETPVAVTVIDRATIAASGAVELVDLLRLVPGFQVAHTSGNLYTVSAHGTGAPWFSRIQVLIDGRSVYHTAFSGLDWAQLGIALPDVERLEVVRGPNIPTYGANAIQGTVNIVTRHPVQDRGWFFQGTLGSTDRLDGVARYAGSYRDLDYRVTLQHRENDGFDGRLDGTRSNSLTFRGILTPTQNDEIDLHLDLTDSTLGDELIPGFFPAANREVRSHSLFLRWTHALGSDQSWYLQYTRDDYETSEDARAPLSQFLGVPPFLVPLLFGVPDQQVRYNQFEADSLRHELEFQHFLTPRPDLRLAWGLGYRWDQIEHFLSARPNGTVDASSARLFGSLEWRPGPRWVVNLGALLDDNSLGGTSLSPRLGLNYRLSDRDTLRFAVTRAHKHPSLLEEHWYAAARRLDDAPLMLWAKSKGDVATERRDVLELGYIGERLDGRLQLDARLYHEDVDGAVIYARDLNCSAPPGVLLPPAVDPGTGIPVGFFCYDVDNHMSFEVRGAELGLTFRPSARGSLRLSYAYADVDGEVPYYLDPAPLGSLPPLLRDDALADLALTAPRHSGSLLYSHSLAHGWQASAALYYADQTYWYLDGDLVDDYLRADLRLAKRLRSGAVDSTLELMVQNLGGTYQEFSAYNDFDTRVYGRLSVSFR